MTASLMAIAMNTLALDSCSECKSKNMMIGGNTYVYEYCMKSLSGTVPNCQTIADGTGNATCQAVWQVSDSNCDYGISPLPTAPISRDPSDGGQWTDMRVRPAVQGLMACAAEATER
jgi:hypothetical protein